MQNGANGLSPEIRTLLCFLLLLMTRFVRGLNKERIEKKCGVLFVIKEREVWGEEIRKRKERKKNVEERRGSVMMPTILQIRLSDPMD
jgi:hypothetical protein